MAMTRLRRRLVPVIRIPVRARRFGAAQQRTRRWLLAGRSLPSGAVLAGLVLLGGSVPAGAQTLTWSVVPSLNRGTTFNLLQEVSCASEISCTAVGYYISGRIARTLIESWDGTGWSVVPSPNRGTSENVVYGVSCASASACMAVGFYRDVSKDLGKTLIESWDGTRWSVVPSPNRAGSNGLGTVSCASPTACMAVGTSSPRSPTIRTLFESWDGTRWTIVPSPSPGTGDVLSGISCSAATACTAVGTHYKSSGGLSSNLIESWDGIRWSVVPSPNGAGANALASVSCVSEDTCTAVGSYDDNGVTSKALIESWDGTRWSVVPSPGKAGNNNHLYGVSCVSDTACTAVGSRSNPAVLTYKTLIESWDGTRWTMVPSPNRAGNYNQLNGVSCPSETTCTAVGSSSANGFTFKTLIESGTGSG
jgi:hypothetical protein